MQSRARHDGLTIAAIGVVAYIAADVAHEVLGHGAACLLTSGKVTLVTSVFFRNEPLSRIVAATEPCGNVVAGALAWFFLRKRDWPASLRFLLVLAMAFNFFWAAGYFIYSGVADTGDWAIALGGPPLGISARASLIVVGVISYWLVTRVTVRALRGVTNVDLTRLVLLPYFAAGAAACLAALFYQRDPVGSVAGAARETFLSNILVLLVPRWVTMQRNAADAVVARDNRWLVTSATLSHLLLSSVAASRRSDALNSSRFYSADGGASPDSSAAAGQVSHVGARPPRF